MHPLALCLCFGLLLLKVMQLRSLVSIGLGGKIPQVIFFYGTKTGFRIIINIGSNAIIVYFIASKTFLDVKRKDSTLEIYFLFVLVRKIFSPFLSLQC